MVIDSAGTGVRKDEIRLRSWERRGHGQWFLREIPRDSSVGNSRSSEIDEQNELIRFVTHEYHQGAD